MRSISVCVLAAVVLFGPSAAVADEATVTDATGDVYEILAGEADEHVPTGTRVNTDVRSTLVDHRADALVVKIRYVELAGKGSGWDVRYRGDVHTRAAYGRDLFQLEVNLRPSLQSASVTLLDTFGVVACPGARAKVQPPRNRLTVRVPRRCLGDPDWVRYRGDALSFTGTGRLFVDYADSPGPSSGPKTEKLYAG